MTSLPVLSGRVQPPIGRVAVVGAGRLGSALVAALGLEAPRRRGYDGADADIVLLCVPDDSIAAAAAAITPREGLLVGHCSGATALDVLAPHDGFSVHPLMTVAGREARFTGAGGAIAGSTPRALAAARAIADALGLRVREIADDRRAAYHAAASMASNYLLALEDAAETLMRSAGGSRDMLVPLVRASVDNWERLGARDALTGPVARGDVATVARQRGAVAEATPDALDLFDALTTATRELAAR